MRQFSLSAICLLVSLCGIVSAQQPLVEYTGNDDPCARFKMQMLVPADRQAEIQQRTQKLKNGIDGKIVWNPCPSPEPQFAVMLSVPARKTLGYLPAQHSLGIKKRAEFSLPQHPSPFDKLLQQ